MDRLSVFLFCIHMSNAYWTFNILICFSRRQGQGGMLLFYVPNYKLVSESKHFWNKGAYRKITDWVSNVLYLGRERRRGSGLRVENQMVSGVGHRRSQGNQWECQDHGQEREKKPVSGAPGAWEQWSRNVCDYTMLITSLKHHWMFHAGK